MVLNNLVLIWVKTINSIPKLVFTKCDTSQFSIWKLGWKLKVLVKTTKHE
jgi:hypothetical protein